MNSSHVSAQPNFLVPKLSWLVRTGGSKDNTGFVPRGLEADIMIIPQFLLPLKSWHKAKTGRTDSLCGFCGCVALSKPSNCSFALTSMSFRLSGAFTHIVAATVAVATTGPPVSTLHESLQLLFEDRQCCKFLKGNSRDVFSIPFPLKRRFGDLFIF